MLYIYFFRLSGIRDHPSNVSNHSSSQSPNFHSLGQTETKKSSGIPLAMNNSHKDRNSLGRNGTNYINVMSGQMAYSNSSEYGVQVL